MDLAIEVEKLNKSFNGKPAVINLTMQVKRGEIFGFLGPNGSGKTTTIRMLCGLLIPDSGIGQCLGYNILTESEIIKKNAGYMTQRFSLYEDLSVEENLDFIARIYQVRDPKKRVEESLVELGFTEHRHQLAGTLSGGWKQRLALAAALIHNPQLLLLDEPTAGVDPKARRDFWDHLHYLSSQGVTILVSTHYMDEAERCHRLAYIAYGHLLAQGTIQNIIDQAKLTTWIVTGKDITSLNAKLEELPGVEQITAFGNTLHVSSKNAALLNKTLAPFKSDPNYQWTTGEPNLEDAFISLVSSTEEAQYTHASHSHQTE